MKKLLFDNTLKLIRCIFSWIAIAFIVHVKIANATPEVYFLPHNYNNAIEKIFKNNFKALRRTYEICDSSLIGLDLVRNYFNIKGCNLVNSSKRISSKIDLVILIDDTKQLSTSLLRFLKKIKSLTNKYGRDVVSPSQINLKGDSGNVTLLIVGEEYYRGINGTVVEKENIWFLKLNIIETRVIPFLKSEFTKNESINIEDLPSELPSKKLNDIPIVLSFNKVPKTDELGTLCFKNGPSKKITSEDVLWLAMMIHGETAGNPSQEDASAMLWAIAHRTFLPHWKNRTVKNLVELYSQPINKHWLKTGKFCKEYYQDSFDGNIRQNCKKTKVDNRLKYRALEKHWNQIDKLARMSAINFSLGKIENKIKGSVGWFAERKWNDRESNGSNLNIMPNREKNNEGQFPLKYLSKIKRNVYYYRELRPNTKSWGYLVEVVGPGETCP